MMNLTIPSVTTDQARGQPISIACWQLSHGSPPSWLPPRGYAGKSGDVRARANSAPWQRVGFRRNRATNGTFLFHFIDLAVASACATTGGGCATTWAVATAKRNRYFIDLHQLSPTGCAIAPIFHFYRRRQEPSKLRSPRLKAGGSRLRSPDR